MKKIIILALFFLTVSFDNQKKESAYDGGEWWDVVDSLDIRPCEGLVPAAGR